jgi:hypothetical protein
MLVHNWQLKLAALALAAMLWVVVSAEQTSSQWIPVPVEVIAANPDQVGEARATPAEVSVRFSGPGREMWEMVMRPPRLLLPIREVYTGERVYVVRPEMVRVPGGPSLEVRDVRPVRVRVRFHGP